MLSTGETIRIRAISDPLLLQDRLINVVEQRDALASVVAECWKTAKDGGDLDGFTIQEIMLRAELIHEREATEDDAEIFDIAQGETIYLLTELGLAALGASVAMGDAP